MILRIILFLSLACLARLAKDAETFRVMSFNVRFASTNQPNAWADRRPIMKDCLRKTDPDIIGTQETTYLQVKDLATDFPEYDWIGLGRDGGSHGEFMAVYFRKKRFEPLEFDHFWLSDTPDRSALQPGETQNRRMVTWIKFLDHKTKQQFYFFNTHFDHKIQEAREKSAALVRARIVGLNTSLPVILTGDFNAPAGQNKAYSILTQDGFMTDTWNTAKKRVNDTIGTFNDFKKESRRPAHRSDFDAQRRDLRQNRNRHLQPRGKYPSDHFPLVAELHLGKTD